MPDTFSANHIYQSKIVYNLNKYLEWHNLPVRVDNRGICNALASICVQYHLEGKLEKFQNILEKISFLGFAPVWDDEVNHFAVQIAISFIPQKFDYRLTQFDSIETLQIAGKSLKSSFNFGIVTKDENWATILKEISLKENEAMLVRSVNHVITIIKEHGIYKVYDPNYVNGFKLLPDEEALVKELHHNVFYYTGTVGSIADSLRVGEILDPIRDSSLISGPLGMSIQIVSHPDHLHNNRVFPDAKALYKKYQLSHEIAIDRFDKNTIDNLYVGVLINSCEAVEQTFVNGFKNKDLRRALGLAISGNRIEVLKILLEKVPSSFTNETLSKLFTIALTTGRKEAFEELLKDDRCGSYFKNHMFTEKNAANLISLASKGGNPELLEQIINMYKDPSSSIPLSDAKIAEKILEYAPMSKSAAIQETILAGSPKCAEVLIRNLDNAKCPLNAEQLLIGLSLSIRANQPKMVELFIDKIKSNSILPADQEKIFKSIKMSTNNVEKTDLSIIKALQAEKVEFSEEAKGVIAIKENQSIGISLFIGITLKKFTDFIKESLNLSHQVKDNIKNFRNLKNNFFESKTQTDGYGATNNHITPK